VSRRVCRYCGRKVPTAYEGDAVAASWALSAVYAEHSCPGDWMPVDVPVTVAPPELAEPPAEPRGAARRVRRMAARSKVRGVRPSMVLAAVGEGPTCFAAIGRALRISTPAAREVVQPLVVAGTLYRYTGGGRSLITPATYPRCPVGGRLTLCLWPHLHRGAYTRSELVALTGSRAHSVSVAVAGLVRAGCARTLPDGRYTCRPELGGA